MKITKLFKSHREVKKKRSEKKNQANEERQDLLVGTVSFQSPPFSLTKHQRLPANFRALMKALIKDFNDGFLYYDSPKFNYLCINVCIGVDLLFSVNPPPSLPFLLRLFSPSFTSPFPHSPFRFSLRNDKTIKPFNRCRRLFPYFFFFFLLLAFLNNYLFIASTLLLTF